MTFVEWCIALVLAVVSSLQPAPVETVEPLVSEPVKQPATTTTTVATEVLSMNTLAFSDVQAASFPASFTLTSEADWWLMGGRWLDLVEQYWGDLGPTHVNIATCVIYGESRGTPDVTNHIGARGLFQVMPANVGKPWFNTENITYADLLDPAKNMQAARGIWDHRESLGVSGWGAWSAYGRAYVQDCIDIKPWTEGYNWALQGGTNG